MSDEFTKYLESKGTKRELTVHDTPGQNGIAERKNRVLRDDAIALLIAAGLPQTLWAEAISHACWLNNRCTT